MPVDLDNATRIVAASSDGRMYSRYPAGNAPSAAWNLPASLNVLNDGTVGLRQYVVNGGDWTISVSGLPTGVTYNSSLERLEGASSGSASATATFTLTLGGVTVQTTATVALVAVGGYTLANAIAGLPFAINTPTAPTITSEATVTPATIGANMVNGRRLTLSSGSYGNLTISGQDMEFVVGAGSTFGTVEFNGSARRIIFRAVVVRDCNMARCTMTGFGSPPEDILVDGITCDAGGTVNYTTGHRIAIINSYLRTIDFPASAFNGIYSNIIIANCYLENYGGTIPGHEEQAGVRFHNISRFVFVDNRVNKNGGSKHVFRKHCWSNGFDADAQYIYVCRNNLGNTRAVQFDPQGTATTTPSIMRDVWFEDNFHCMTTNWNGFVQVSDSAGTIERFSVRNNTLRGDYGSVFGSPTPSPPWIGPDWVVSGNSIGPYEDPPAWEFQ